MQARIEDKSINLNRDKCVVCGACSAVCPTEALVIIGMEPVFFPSKCNSCGLAALVCPSGALQCP